VRAHAEFTSAIGPIITRYVTLKRTLGLSFHVQRQLLSQLDRYLAALGASDLTAVSFSEWSRSLGHLTVGGRRLRLSVVARFCRYRRRSEPACFVPDASLFPRPSPRRRPHIFSVDEIGRLLRAAAALRPNATSPLCPEVARLALVLAYTAGLRRGEIVRLTLGDHDAKEQTLLVRDSKFRKSRLVPVSADAAREIEAYLRERMRPGLPRGADAPLLLHAHGGLRSYTGSGLAHMLRKLFRAAAVRTSSGRTPRVHDLRFTFAVHALARLYRTDADVQAKLPALATYMGHASVASTQYYLACLDEVAQQASQRFERHCSGFLAGAWDPDPGGAR